MTTKKVINTIPTTILAIVIYYLLKKKSSNTKMSSVTIQDIILIEQVIRSSQSRGAIQASEMTQVGHLYDKIVTIINNAKEQAEKQLKNQVSQGEVHRPQHEKTPRRSKLGSVMEQEEKE